AFCLRGTRPSRRDSVRSGIPGRCRRGDARGVFGSHEAPEEATRLSSDRACARRGQPYQRHRRYSSSDDHRAGQRLRRIRREADSYQADARRPQLTGNPVSSSLFERVLVLRGGAASVDRVEGRLLLAGRGRDGRGAGLAGEGVLLDTFEKEFGVFVLSPGHLTRFLVPALDRPFFEGWVFPVTRIERGNDAGSALTGIETWESRDQSCCPFGRAIRAVSIDRETLRIGSNGFGGHSAYSTESMRRIRTFSFRSDESLEGGRDICKEGCEVNPI